MDALPNRAGSVKLDANGGIKHVWSNPLHLLK
jgi:hypothetical protein